MYSVHIYTQIHTFWQLDLQTLVKVSYFYGNQDYTILPQHMAYLRRLFPGVICQRKQHQINNPAKCSSGVQKFHRVKFQRLVTWIGKFFTEEQFTDYHDEFSNTTRDGQTGQGYPYWHIFHQGYPC